MRASEGFVVSSRQAGAEMVRRSISPVLLVAGHYGSPYAIPKLILRSYRCVDGSKSLRILVTARNSCCIATMWHAEQTICAN